MARLAGRDRRRDHCHRQSRHREQRADDDADWKETVDHRVVTTDSIAWAVAERAQLHNAEVILTTFDRVRELTETAGCGAASDARDLTLGRQSQRRFLAVG